MTEQEKAKQFVDKAPPLTREELDSINALFPTYIFRRSKTNEIWTTCCRRHEKLEIRNQAEYAVLIEPHKREPKNRWWAAHKETVACPFCGREAIVKELQYTGKRKNLSSWRRVVVLRWYRGALWARAYDCGKHYTDGYSLTGDPDCHMMAVYRFQPGLAEAVVRYFWNYPFGSVYRQDGPLTKRRWNIPNPFHKNYENGIGYRVIGLDEIQKSQFRYCMAEEEERRSVKFMQFLTACCFYPRQIEMLMKAGMQDVVMDLTERGVKHAAVIDWDESDPKKAFKISRQNLKAFLGTSRDIRILELHKKLKGHVPLMECADWIGKDVDVQGTFQAAKKWNLAPEKLMRYLAGNVGCHRYGGMSNMTASLQYWKDYLTAAEALGYQLHRENVLLPRALGAAHDEATTKHRKQLERERKAEERERDRLMAASYVERRKMLEEKYGFSMDGYIIRIPAGKDEILDEGRKLQHCVTGYADRHMNGTVTILFMRKEKQPDVPWLTIEMRGNRLVQIHGYKNEGVHTSKGRFAPDPAEVYKDFLDTWLDWLKKGSKRDKKGNPKLPVRMKKGAAA